MAEPVPLNGSKSQEEEDLPSFNITLTEGIGDGANFRTSNDPKKPWQRKTVTEREGLVSISCVSKDVVHGFYSEEHVSEEGKSEEDQMEEEDDEDDDEDEDEDEDDETSNHCSLIILQFRFDPNHLGRRIKMVKIGFTFSAIDSEDDDPVVDKIFPDGFFFVYPTTQKEKTSTEASAKIGGKVMGPEVSGKLKREKVVEKDVTHAGTVRGAIRTEGRTFGKPNTASWTLMENTADKTGAPVSMRAAILVTREPGSNFQAHFTIKVTPDNLTAAQTLFRSDPKDDPVLYKVSRKPTNKLHRYDKETIDEEGKFTLVKNLGRLDLESPEFSDITFRTIWKNAEKTK